MPLWRSVGSDPACDVMTQDVYIGLGSNLGDRFQVLQNAVDRLSEVLEGCRCSPVYETAPWGVADQPE